MLRLTASAAAARARALVRTETGSPDVRARRVLGITGPPGAGKSTLAAAVVAAVPGAVLVGMDGFHLAHRTLERLGEVDRKGAPHTFDAAGYVALLRRIRTGRDDPVWAPEFRRDLEDAIAGAIPVAVDAPLVVTEGNYLLLDEPPWSDVPDLCDEIWYVDPPRRQRITWLVARHERYGRSYAEALGRAYGSDERNAVLIEATRHRADVLVDTGSVLVGAGP